MLCWAAEGVGGGRWPFYRRWGSLILAWACLLVRPCMHARPLFFSACAFLPLPPPPLYFSIELRAETISVSCDEGDGGQATGRFTVRFGRGGALQCRYGLLGRDVVWFGARVGFVSSCLVVCCRITKEPRLTRQSVKSVCRKFFGARVQSPCFFPAVPVL